MRYLITLLKISGVLAMMALVTFVSGFLTMKILLGEDDISVPELLGKNLEEVSELLKEKGLHLKVEEEYNSLIPKGHVVSQKPAANTLTKKAREIKVVVSLGQRKVLVPDVVGETMRQAKNTLRKSGFSDLEVLQVHSEEHPLGTVITQSPNPYREVWSETTIKLLVSWGSPQRGYYMTDFSGKSLNEAKKLIQKLGLRLGTVAQEASSSVLAGFVLRQTPLPGFKVETDQPVNLVVSQGAGAAATAQEGIMTPFRYVLPGGDGVKMVRIVVENRSGKKEILRQERRAGEEIRLLVGLSGKTVVKVYLDDTLVEEKVIEP